MSRFYAVIALFAVLSGVTVSQCPDQDPDLEPWDPVSDSTRDVVINGGQKFLLVGTDVQLRTITIQNSGKLVIKDDGVARRLRVRHILITSNGEMWVGSDTCPYQSNFDLVLQGRSDDTDIPEQPIFGRKFIGVAPTATLVIYGTNKLSWTNLQTTITPGSSNTIVDLADVATNWNPGDRVVVASSDYDMYHAEEFTLAACASCTSRQVQLTETALYTHLGTYTAQGIDTRAEIGMLTHNIRIYGEMESACYGSNKCEYFDYDTFGGHIQMLSGFTRADFFGVELFNMGQQLLGKYPIHYHVVGAVYGSYVRRLSVHHCFSRCVTLHASEGLTVQDVVGYDTLGHCYFLEDGNEQNNQLIHNLGLVTKPGTLLPSDRDKNMCETMLGNVYPGYVPNAEEECMEVATFWITHPNNTFRNNSAAGSYANGYHYVFHRVPTGPSAGTLPAYHGERSTIPMFIGNKAHSNPEHGLLIDRGVKVDQASQDDPREFLAMSDYARYMPHQNRDPLQPRSPAYIVELTSYKNGRGAAVRGGDVFIQNSKFSDNDVGVTLTSYDLLPYDAGSSQQLTGSIVAATETHDAEWLARPYPAIGVQLSGGASLVDQNYFYGYMTGQGRETYAIGFVPQYWGQFGTISTIGSNSGDDSTGHYYFGRNDPSSIHGTYDADGDWNQVFYDRNGYLAGWPNSTLVRLDNMLLRGDSCATNPATNSAACTGNYYGQLFVNATTKSETMTIQRPSPPNYPLTLQGANKADLVNFPDTTQFQAALVGGRDYLISFSGQTPNWLQLSSYNLPQTGYFIVGIEYRGSTPTFTSINYSEWQQMPDLVTVDVPLTAGSSQNDVINDLNGNTYYFDSNTNILWVKLVNHYAPSGYNYCASEGCQFITVTST